MQTVELCDNCLTLVEGEGFELFDPASPEPVKLGMLCPKCGRECLEWLEAKGVKNE